MISPYLNFLAEQIGGTSARAKRPTPTYTQFSVSRDTPAPFLAVSPQMISDHARLDVPLDPGSVSFQPELYDIYTGAAIAWLENRLGQPIIRGPYTQIQDRMTSLPLPGGVRNRCGILLRRSPFPGTVPQVSYFAETDPIVAVPLVAGTDYYQDRNLLVMISESAKNISPRETGGFVIRYDAGYVDWPTYPVAPTQAQIDAARLKVKPEDVFSISALVSLMDTQREGSQDDIRYQATAKLQGITPAQIQMVLGHRWSPSITGNPFGGRMGQ
jgi:hypothetical protein